MNSGSPKTGLRRARYVQGETALPKKDHSTIQVGRQREEQTTKKS